MVNEGIKHDINNLSLEKSGEIMLFRIFINYLSLMGQLVRKINYFNIHIL